MNRERMFNDLLALHGIGVTPASDAPPECFVEIPDSLEIAPLPAPPPVPTPADLKAAYISQAVHSIIGAYVGPDGPPKRPAPFRADPRIAFSSKAAFLLHRRQTSTYYKLLSTELGLTVPMEICSVKTCVSSAVPGTRYCFSHAELDPAFDQNKLFHAVYRRGSADRPRPLP
jgi:hypothetical protein